MLSPLQERVAEIIAGLKEAEGFALAGGAALIVRGDVRRQTRDLDFFGLDLGADARLFGETPETVCDDNVLSLAMVDAAVRSSRERRTIEIANVLADADWAG